jgi:hypothetical protein
MIRPQRREDQPGPKGGMHQETKGAEVPQAGPCRELGQIDVW